MSEGPIRFPRLAVEDGVIVVGDIPPAEQPSKKGGGGDPPDDPTAKAKVVENERWKYLATFVNTVAAASIAVGVFTPIAKLLSEGFDRAQTVDLYTIGGFALIWFGLAVGLHCIASCFLGNLRP